MKHLKCKLDTFSKLARNYLKTYSNYRILSCFTLGFNTSEKFNKCVTRIQHIINDKLPFTKKCDLLGQLNPNNFKKYIKELFLNGFFSCCAQILSSCLTCFVKCFVKWYSEWHSVMSTCINSFPKRGIQYSNCVCTGTTYLYFSFISEGLQVLYRFLWKTVFL